MECARDGGQFAGWELTGAAGLSEDESHGQAPYFQKYRPKLLVLADVDRMHGVGEPQLFECNGSLAAVGRGPRIEINHGVVPVLV